ncbi:MAG: ATP-dependent DNA helicase RecG [Thermoleophilaceae bacterium]|nr:ATP-dependent DNA helicase RecG [Thermoleophilaceae bacterium]
MADFSRVIGGGDATIDQLAAAPIRWPRPSLLRAPLPVGPKTLEAADRLEIHDLGDLIEHVPVTHEFRAGRQIKQLKAGEEATIEVELRSISLRPTRRRNLRLIEAVVVDDSGSGKAVWFNQQWLAKQLEPGTHLRLFGKFKGGAFQVKEHAVIAASEGGADSGPISVYPGTEGLKSQRLRELVDAVWGIELEVIDPLPGRLRARERLMGRADALAEMHFPSSQRASAAGRERLAYEELLLQQLALGMRRRRRVAGRGALELPPQESVVARWRERLPFDLTGDQREAIATIDRDLARSVPMQRLLMGEVGSGKTVVALSAMLRAAENDAQAALMAPTETLAEQHFATLDAMLPEVPLALLTGSTPAARRKEILARLATGELPLIVGTHALIEDSVEFRRLALAVVDEQHRFGVRQRAALDAKAPGDLLPHVLHMTATPIPRTLALTGYGDLDFTQIKQLPRGRRPISTRVVGDAQRADAYDQVREQLRAGRQAYVVCPLVSESEVMQVRAATVEYERLAAGELKDFRVRLIHGQLPSAEKAAAMKAFSDHEADVLVATSVIEVGIDVPNATVMIIEDADRYGISQLHQLRGRVGRGEHDSSCLLFGNPASRRLRAVAAERDGFKLAQVDLELRGSGEELGTRQSGLPRFRVAVLPEDNLLLERANIASGRLLDADDALEAPELSLLRRAVIARYGDEIDPIPA